MKLRNKGKEEEEEVGEAEKQDRGPSKKRRKVERKSWKKTFIVVSKKAKRNIVQKGYLTLLSILSRRILHSKDLSLSTRSCSSFSDSQILWLKRTSLSPFWNPSTGLPPSLSQGSSKGLIFFF